MPAALTSAPSGQLPVVLAAIVTEESRRARAMQPSSVRLKFDAERVIHRLRTKEIRHQIAMPIREMDFSLAAPVYAWAIGLHAEGASRVRQYPKATWSAFCA